MNGKPKQYCELLFTIQPLVLFVRYDSVDRSFPTWQQGAIPVRAETQTRVEFTGFVAEDRTAWPGSIALDDIDYSPGPCLVTPGRCR